MTDRTFSPWPAPGKIFSLRWRRAVWISARPWYGNYMLTDLRRLFVIRLPLPFITLRTSWVHGYLGWKPITLDDPKFYWRDLVDLQPGELAVQISARMGTGGVD